MGSTFGATENDAIYHLLMPLNPPSEHALPLELGTKVQTPARNSCFCVELQCMCTWEHLAGGMLCFLRHPEDELRHQDSSLLDTLCSSSYLDVQKMAKWFQELMIEAWVAMPQSSKLQLMMLPFTCFFKLRLTNDLRKTLSIKLMLGVQQDNLDTFLSFKYAEAIVSCSMRWPQSCTVQFFRTHLGMLGGTFRLRHLQLCVYILLGANFATHALKTAVNHLLTTIPLASMHRRDFQPHTSYDYGGYKAD